LKDDSLLQYGPAKAIIEKYTLQLSQGEKWLNNQVKLETESTDQCQARPWTLDQLKTAFDLTPNEISAQVLLLFIAQMCFNIDLGKSTAEQIHAGFKWWWSQCVYPRVSSSYHVLKVYSRLGTQNAVGQGLGMKRWGNGQGILRQIWK
jgi:hypothetical protein